MYFTFVHDALSIVNAPYLPVALNMTKNMFLIYRNCTANIFVVNKRGYFMYKSLHVEKILNFLWLIIKIKNIHNTTGIVNK